VLARRDVIRTFLKPLSRPFISKRFSTGCFQVHGVLHVEVGAERRQTGDHADVGDVEQDFAADAIDAEVGADRRNDVDHAQDDGRNVGLDGGPGGCEDGDL
jgi:hypothetical protein